MHKSLVILIILGLIFPVLYTKSTGASRKPRILSNAEESLDFWDFNPHADSASTTTQAEKVTSTGSAVNNKKSTMGELEQILKDMEATLSKLGRNTNDRFLLEVETRTVVSSEEENLLIGENTEVILSEEQLLAPTDNNNTDDNQEEPEAEEALQSPDDTLTQPPTEAEESGEGNNNTDVEQEPTEEETETEEPEQEEPILVTEPETRAPVFEAQNTEAGTATLSGSIEYDMPFGGFDQQSGKVTFLNAIVSTLGIDDSMVRITNIREGSVIFDFEITLPAGDQETADSSASTLTSYADRLEGEARDGGSLSVFDDAAILDFQRKVTVFAPASEFNTTIPKDDSLITVLVVVAAVVILGAIGFFVYKNKVAESESKSVGKDPKYKPASNKKSPERLDLESRGTASRSSLGEEINDKIKLFAASPPSDSSL